MRLFIFLTMSLMCVCLSSIFSEANCSAEDVFTQIYTDAVWGRNAEGEGFSGQGAVLENAQEYKDFLQNFLKSRDIRTVIDIGCGDWGFSKHIEWNGITYVGYDVVQKVIERNQKKYSSPSITFIHADATQLDLPSADLLICKDVMMHLPHEDNFILCSQFHKFKYCLIINNVDKQTLSSNNNQISYRGGFRTLDLTKPPYSLNGEKVLTYKSEKPEVVKLVILVTNDVENH